MSISDGWYNHCWLSVLIIFVLQKVNVLYMFQIPLQNTLIFVVTFHCNHTAVKVKYDL